MDREVHPDMEITTVSHSSVWNACFNTVIRAQNVSNGDGKLWQASLSLGSWFTSNAEKAGRRAADVNSKCMPSSMLGRNPHFQWYPCLIGQFGDGLGGIDLVCLMIEGKGGTVIVGGAGLFPGPSLLPHRFPKCPDRLLDLPPMPGLHPRRSKGSLNAAVGNLSIGG